MPPEGYERPLPESIETSVLKPVLLGFFTTQYVFVDNVLQVIVGVELKAVGFGQRGDRRYRKEDVIQFLHR